MTHRHRAVSARLLARAAELRATGYNWDSTAAAVGCAADTCRSWPRLYPAAWRRAYAAAVRRQITEAGVEGLAHLRVLLRSEDEKMRRDGAKVLAGLLGRALPSVDDGLPNSDPRPTEDLTDDALRDLIRSVVPELTTGEDPPHPGGTGPARPD